MLVLLTTKHKQRLHICICVLAIHVQYRRTPAYNKTIRCTCIYKQSTLKTRLSTVFVFCND